MTFEELTSFWVALSPLTKLAVFSGVIQALGYIAYGWYVARKQIEPNPTSWFMWAYGTALVAVLEYTQIKQDQSASMAILVLPTVCAISSIGMALLCWIRGTLTWPEHPMDIFAFVADVALSLGLVVITIMHANGALTTSDRNLLELSALIVVNLTSFTSFTPMVRELLQKPEQERVLPWILWACAYATLALLTLCELGEDWFSALMLYPVLNVAIHTSVASLVFFGKRRCKRAAP